MAAVQGSGTEQRGVAALFIQKRDHKSPQAQRITYYCVRMFCAQIDVHALLFSTQRTASCCHTTCRPADIFGKEYLSLGQNCLFVHAVVLYENNCSIGLLLKYTSFILEYLFFFCSTKENVE